MSADRLPLRLLLLRLVSLSPVPAIPCKVICNGNFLFNFNSITSDNGILSVGVHSNVPLISLPGGIIALSLSLLPSLILNLPIRDDGVLVTCNDAESTLLGFLNLNDKDFVSFNATFPNVIHKDS